MTRTRVRWNIWYDDGTQFSSEKSNWIDAPEDGVLFVLEYFSDGKKQVHMGSDYYLMREDTIMGVPLVHLDRHLRLGIPQGSVKFGRWTTQERWKQAHEEVFGVKP